MKAEFPQAGKQRCESAIDTQAFGEELGRYLEAGDVVILDGPLGAGKTTFTQGIARGLEVTGRVTSPTFVIAREHRTLANGPSLIHVDAYRLLGEGDTDPIGALDSLDLDTDLQSAVVVAEWGGDLVEHISDQFLLISIDRETAVLEDPQSQARFISWKMVSR